MADEAVLFVYVTAASADEARRIGRALVEEGLAACVNLPAPHTAIYRWEGAVAEDTEQALIAKTTAARLDELARRVRALSSYDVPCIVALPVTAGDAEFLAWVGMQVRLPPSG
ncbi:divalent-cation tolerance protein CutA [Elioraea sp.]|uniref:divalent-cation tolerance protein CutA n=1 Tax=Elioraea sp. TaxID=2185103 RepID=UPI003F6E7DC1